MDDYKFDDIKEPEGNIITGTIGAFFGAIMGAAFFAVVSYVGYFSSWVAILTVFCVRKGYDRLYGRKGKIRTAIIVIFMLLSVVLGTLAGEAVILLEGFHAEMDALPVFDQAMVRRIYPDDLPYLMVCFQDSDIQLDLLKKLVLGLIFSLLGIYCAIPSNRKNDTTVNLNETDFSISESVSHDSTTLLKVKKTEEKHAEK